MKMTLDDAIKHCYERAEELREKDGCLECAHEHEELAGWLKELKKRRANDRPKGEWIPVSERLPEKEGEYILWGKIYESEEEDYPFIGRYDESEQFGIWQEQFDAYTLGTLGSEFYEYSRVVAWQPLPEPYKEADNEQE